MAESVPWDEICGPEEKENPVAVGDVLTADNPEPPPGTVVRLIDGELWRRLRRPRLTYRRWQWVRTKDGADYPNTRWHWVRVTFDGPVTVVKINSDR